MNKKTETLIIRIDTDLLNQLKQQAMDDRRSLSEYVYLMLLDESVKRHAEKHFNNNLIKPLLSL